jgi:hypothetical protein
MAVCSEKAKPIPVVIWTDSYGSDWHYFPECLQTETESRKEILKAAGEDLPFEIKKINAVPGRMLDNRSMEEIEINFHWIRKGEAQMNVILLGGNDIQTHAYNGAARFLANIRTLTKWHDGSNCPLMLCGIPPRPEVHYQIEDLANYVDSKMKEYMTSRHAGNAKDCMFKFTKTYDFFRDENGFCMTLNLYEKDEIHLNKAGAAKLCKRLCKEIEDQARDCMALGITKN